MTNQELKEFTEQTKSKANLFTRIISWLRSKFNKKKKIWRD